MSDDDPGEGEPDPPAADAETESTVVDGTVGGGGDADGPANETVDDGGEPQSAGVAQATASGPTQSSEGVTARSFAGERGLDSRVRIQWFVRVASYALVLGLVAGAISRFGFGIDPLVGVGVGAVAIVLGTLWVVAHYRLWRFEVRDDSLYLERGVVTNVRTVVPFVRIQHVDSQRSALERALGLSRIVVYTAGSRGADVSIPGLEPDEARDLQARIKELAIEAEGEDAV